MEIGAKKLFSYYEQQKLELIILNTINTFLYSIITIA